MTKQLPIGKIKYYFICGNGGDRLCVAGAGGGDGDVEEGKREETDNDYQEKVFVR